MKSKSMGCGPVIMILVSIGLVVLIGYQIYLDLFVYTDTAPSRYVQRVLADAEDGYADDQYKMGLFLTTGMDNLPADPDAAMRWFEKAAAQNHIDALYHLGYLYKQGKSVNKDIAKAIDLFRRAERLGSPAAENAMGELYLYGDGVEENVGAAVALFRKAAEAGYAPAQRNMGIVSAEGYEQERDYNQAYQWYLKAAENRSMLGIDYDSIAYNNIGLLYEQEQGVERDIIRAYACYQNAVGTNNTRDPAIPSPYLKAKDNIERLKKVMDPQELRKAFYMDCLSGTYVNFDSNPRVRQARKYISEKAAEIRQITNSSKLQIDEN